MSKLVKNNSSAFGYNYASLADIVKQGFEIPQMRIKPTEFGDYIEYKDPDTGEWYIGSKVVMPEMKGKNSAQMYGAGLTYARRYCTLNALKLICSDDVDVETCPQPVEKHVEKSAATDTILMINKCQSEQELTDLWKTLTESEKAKYKFIFTKRKSELQ